MSKGRFPASPSLARSARGRAPGGPRQRSGEEHRRLQAGRSTRDSLAGWAPRHRAHWLASARRDRDQRPRPHHHLFRRHRHQRRPAVPGAAAACPGWAGGGLRGARQELHREVALKQILEQHADDPVSRSGSSLEAEITGGLEHPGIVPVYGLGPTPTAGRITPCGSSGVTAQGGDRALPRRRPRRRSRPPIAGAAQAAAPLHRRLQRHRLRPQPRGAAPRHQAGQYHRRQVRRDPGGGLGPGQGDRPEPIHPPEERTLVPRSASGRRDAARQSPWARRPT